MDDAATAEVPSQRRYSIAQLMILVPLVALVVDAWAPIRDNSFLWHIRAGALQADSGEVLTSDPFSFTVWGEPWLTQSWLVELLYGGAEDLTGGLGFVPPMLLAVSVLTFGGIALVAFQRSGSALSTAIVMMLSVILLISFIVPRPVLFSYALFVLVILAWSQPRFRWTLPFIFWIWASVHGSFAIGLGFVGLSLISEKEWRWLPTAFVAGFATLLTAHGLGVVQMLLDFAEARETLSLLSEWRRPELTSVVFLPFLLGLGIMALGFARGRLKPRHLWVLVPFVILGFTSTRSVPPAWIGLIPFISLSLGDLRPLTAKRLSAPIAAVVAAFMVVFPFLIAGDGELDAERFPVEASAELADGNTFHDDRVGGYLIWRDGPERLVYLDDRAELYQERIAEFVDVRNLRTPWEPVFERDGIEQVLLRVEEELVGELVSAGWSPVYEDEHYVVLR